MRTIAVSALLATAALPAQAQIIEADIGIRSGPVDARVTVVDGYSTYRDPRVVVIRDRAPDVIVVERWRAPRGRAYGWWHRNGYRPIVVYVWGDRFYGRPWRAGMREVVVFERGGRFYWDRDFDRFDRVRFDRYYRYDYDRYGRWSRYDRDDDWNRGGRRWNDRDDRWDDRDGRWDDRRDRDRDRDDRRWKEKDREWRKR